MADSILLPIKKSLYEGETVFLIERRTIIVVDGVVTDEIMFYFFLLLRGGGCGSDRYLFVYLSGVCIDNWRVEMLGYRQGCFALSHTRRTEKYKQCIQCIDLRMMLQQLMFQRMIPRFDVEMKSMIYWISGVTCSSLCTFFSPSAMIPSL